MRLPHLLLVSLLSIVLGAQDAALKDSFNQAKASWSAKGDREGATSGFERVVAALAPRAGSLEPDWIQTLCESYNWLAILDDRIPQYKVRAQSRLQALIDLNPDFEVDRAITSLRLATLFDRMKAEKYAVVKLSYAPDGGRLSVNGKPGPALARKYLPFGSHKLTYARPGHTSADLILDLSPRDVKTHEFKVSRVSSTVTFHVHPTNVEVILDGRSLGKATGKAGPEAAAQALALGVRIEELSAPFTISELPPGRHLLELRAPCHRPKTVELGAELATPLADHTLQPPLRLTPSRGTLTVRSPWPGGELFLSGQSQGPLPVKDLPVCSGPYDLQVRFPAGGFTQRITMEEGKSLSLEVRPKPRLAFLGLEGGEFTGKSRFVAQLDALGDRLQQLAFLPPRGDETPQEALTRLKASRNADLLLMARTAPDRVLHRIELVLATLDGEEERLWVKPLEQDPLGALVTRLNTIPITQEPGLGLTLLDVAGEPGPWVLAASEAALKAGIRVERPLLQIEGRPASSVQAFRHILRDAKGSVSVNQGDGDALILPIQQEPLEIPLGSPDLSYPALLAHLRLKQVGAKGDEANLVKLNLALALMHFRKYEKAIELLGDAKLSTVRGVSQGTIDYHTGLCFLQLGPAYLGEAAQAFRQALKYPHATLLGPDGPLVVPLAKQALEDLK